MNTRGPASKKSERDTHLAWSKVTVMEYYSEIKTKLERKNVITGNDLISLGMKPGPEMGRALEKIREDQDAGLILDRNTGFALAEKLVKERDPKSGPES